MFADKPGFKMQADRKAKAAAEAAARRAPMLRSSRTPSA